MAQNITLLGASYSDVPAVTLPKTGGGTATFMDTSDADAAASDIASGKTAYVNGVKVEGTSSGGGTDDDDIPLKDVVFIDYDGTILHNYTKEEFLALNEMPANPSHAGLIAQGWNWTLEDAQEYVQKYGIHCIGQNYITTDGKTKFYIKINESEMPTKSIRIRTSSPSAINYTFDWGDGITQTYTNKNGSQYFDHTYSDYGEYIVNISTTGDYRLGYNGSNYSVIGDNDYLPQRICVKVEIGSNVIGFGRGFLGGAANLKSITFPASAFDHQTGGNGTTFISSHRLRGVVFPPNFGIYSGEYLVSGGYIRFLSLPKSMTTQKGISLGNLRMLACPPISTISSNNFVYNCSRIERLAIPGTYTELASNRCRNLPRMTEITLPESLETISGYGLSWLYNLREMHCKRTTPPTLNNTRTLANIPASCVIYVPYSEDHSILDAYKSATNWSSKASQMVEEPQ